MTVLVVPRLSWLVNSIRRRRHLSRRRGNSNGRLGLLRLQLANLRYRYRFAAICLNRLVLLGEGRRWRRRRGLGDHGPILERGRGLDSGRCAPAEHALLLRNHRRSSDIHWRARHFPGVHFDHVFRHRLCRSEGFVRGGGHGARYALIDIFNVCDIRVVHDVRVVHSDVFVHHGVVVVVVHNRRVHRSIRNIYVVHVSAADGIGRHVDFTRSQGEPGNARADSHAHTPMRATDPGNQRWRIHRTNVRHAHNDRSGCAGYPTPNAANSHPPAIVEGSKAPGFIIDPRPAPRGNPNPMAVAIGCPADDRGVRKPDPAVFGYRAPATVVIKVFVTDGIRGDIPRGF